MNLNYMKRSAMLLGVAAMATVANAEYVDVTSQYLKDPTYMPAWQGVITGHAEGVAEVWNAAFRAYQTLKDLPAGEYTLTVNAFYRCGYNEFAKDNMKDGRDDLYTAYIFAGENKQTVLGLFDKALYDNARGYEDWDNWNPETNAPNSLYAANDAFNAGQYVNTLKFNHEGGDLTLGICNTGCYQDEWCAFDNFKLVGPEGEVTIPNGNFDEGLNSKRAWDNWNNGHAGEKTPDMQKDGSSGGAYRKTGGTEYNIGQKVTLPAGTYRFGMQCLHRYGSTQDPTTGEYFHHKSGEIVDVYGRVLRTPKQWWEANDYDAQDSYDHAYIYVSFNEEKPYDLNSADDFGDLGENDIRVRVKDCWEICNGDVASMPDNNCYGKNRGELPYETKNKCVDWHDSGREREAAAAFVAEPEKWYQYVEFTLPEETTVWVGLGKNTNTGDGFWHSWANQTLTMLVDDNAVEGVEAIANAAPEYFNLQGVRVANPENGIYVVREGNKVSKKVIR